MDTEWVKVPKKLTFGMRVALETAVDRHADDVDRVYRELLDYAPAYKAASTPEQVMLCPHPDVYNRGDCCGKCPELVVECVRDILTDWNFGPMPDRGACRDLQAGWRQHTGCGMTSYAIQERAVSENPDAGPQGKGWQEDIAFTLEARNKVQAVVGTPQPAANDNLPIAATARSGQELRFLSVCSGIEAASVAWGPLGWKAVGFAEIDPSAALVLHRHYNASLPLFLPNPGDEGLKPKDRRARIAAIKAILKMPAEGDITNWGDFTKIDIAKVGRVNILCGGTPCQAFSVAGARKSLADARGNLSLAFVSLRMRSRKTTDSETLFGKMFPESSTPRTTPSDVSWRELSEQMMPCVLQKGANGPTQVWLPGHGHGRHGGFSTLNTSASPNDAAVCSLSQILETGPIPQRYFLSAQACRGILRRAVKRGKELPQQLARALKAVAG